jgi:CheY-like chemotaxis protein
VLTVTADARDDTAVAPNDASGLVEDLVPKPSLAPYTVLVVDDDEDLRDLVSQKLFSAGFAVLTAADGSEALDTLQDNIRFDLVLLDIMMPGISGLDVCRKIRDDPRTAEVPVMLVTARTHPAFAQEGFSAGANGYLSKPFSPRMLVSEVRGMITGIY